MLERFTLSLPGLVPQELIAEIEEKARQWGKNNG